MAAKHGTRRCYSVEGCRCADCREAQAAYQAEYRSRVANGEVGASVAQLPLAGPGPVEAAIRQEIEGLPLAAARPALVETAVTMAKILDNPRAVSQQPAAAGKLADIMDRLHNGSVARRGGFEAGAGDD
jgi:hypothetical protein